jgi:uncharacterized repeat protein (TIGR02543 family)
VGSSNITFYAKWTIRTYTLTYDGNGSTSGAAPSAVVQNYNTTVSISDRNTLEKTGYTFSGWKEFSNGTGTTYSVSSTFTFTETRTIYAYWVIKSYTLTYDGNGSTGGTAPSSVVQDYNTDITVAGRNTLVKDGYSFSGWRVNADGTGAAYPEGSTYTITDTATIYAKWTADPTYSVNYDDNVVGETIPVPSDSNSYLSGDIVTISSTEPTRSGYTFNGWTLNSANTGTIYKIGGTTTYTVDSSNITFYAKWTKNSNPDGPGDEGNPPPRISSLSKTEFCAIRNEVIIYGFNFDGANVTFDGVPTTIVEKFTSTLVVILPSRPVGKKLLVITTPGGSTSAFVNYVTTFEPTFHPIRIPYLSQGVELRLGLVVDFATSFSLIGNLPSGVILDAATGLISGVPTENGIFTFEIVATGVCGETKQVIELDVDAPTPNATSYRINFLPNSCVLSDSVKASFEAFIRKIKGISPRNIIPEIYISGGSKNSNPDSPLAQCRQESICDFLIIEELVGQVLNDVFTGSENRVEIIVYWPRPNDE